MSTGQPLPPPPPGTGPGINLKDVSDKTDRLEKEIEDLKKRLVKLEK
jgi:ubiquinone biosynthesis protein UbiJ